MKPKLLTNAQAVELKWFCQNVRGVQKDFYPVMEEVRTFEERIKRLEKTCDLIEKYLGQPIEPFESPWKTEDEESPTRPIDRGER